MSTSFLLIVQIVLVVLLTIIVLLQKSSSIGLGAYSGSNDSVFGAKGPNSFLAKTTFILGFLFVVNTLTLGYLYSQANQESVLDDLLPQTNVAAPTVPVTQTQTIIDTEVSQEKAEATVADTPATPAQETQTTK